MKIKSILLMCILPAILCTPAPAKIIYVDNDSPADFNNIQAAIDDANNGDTVIVADGTYTGNGNRDIDFKGKAITVKSQDGPETCIIDCKEEWYEYYRGFCFHSNEDANSILDGFKIINGCVAGCGLIYGGGAIFCSTSSPKITNCIISNNRAIGGCVRIESNGGGIYCIDSDAEISNCIISGNSAIEGGGGIYFQYGKPSLTNCTITDNKGLGIACIGSSLTIKNCIFLNNSIGPLLNHKGVTNVVFSNISNDWQGIGNFDLDPLFVTEGYWDSNNNTNYPYTPYWIEGDYHLKSQAGRWDMNSQSWIQDDVTSPCIDTGDPNSPIGLEPFPNGGYVNMGAYGGTSQASKSYFGKPVCETIVAGDINGDCKVDELDLYILMLHWLENNNP